MARYNRVHAEVVLVVEEERKKLTILVTGSRDWNTDAQIECIYEELSKYVDPNIDVTLVHGAARGVDTIAATIGEELGFKVVPYPADWVQYKKAAGPIRNAQMLREGKPDLVIAFHDDIAKSKGTKHMFGIADKAKVESYLVTGLT